MAKNTNYHDRVGLATALHACECEELSLLLGRRGRRLRDPGSYDDALTRVRSRKAQLRACLARTAAAAGVGDS
jgi:hypothetical protein